MILWIMFSLFLSSLAASLPEGLVSVSVSIENHYAVTKVTTKMTNPDTSSSTDLTFATQIPQTAFISDFRMTTDAGTFVGEVMENESAKEVYDGAVRSGKSAGLVANRDSRVFEQAVNVGPGGEAVFELTYEELLTKRLGWLEYKLDIPKVKNSGRIEVEAMVKEIDGIAEFETMTPMNPSPQWKYVSKDTVSLSFEGNGDETNDVSFRYKTSPSSEIGSFVMDSSGEEFVYLFSPPKLDSFAKKVVFVLDKSGSMYGKKFQQLQASVVKIIDSFNKYDLFDIVFFDSDVEMWKPDLQLASAQNKQLAKDYVMKDRQMHATNIELGMRKGLEILEKSNDVSSVSAITYAPIVILLTDGEPNMGISNPALLRSEVLRQNTNSVPIYTLGFGEYLNYELIRAIALENNGFDRKIHEGSDVVEQLSGFFDEINAATMSDIQLRLTTDVKEGVPITEVTKTDHKYLFEGSEIVVAGKIPEGASVVHIHATGTISNGQRIKYSKTFSKEDAILQKEEGREAFVSAQRTFAFLTIQELQKQIDVATEEDVKLKLKEEITSKSLEHHFVTKYTSLVVSTDDVFVDSEPEICVNGRLPDGRGCGFMKNIMSGRATVTSDSGGAPTVTSDSGGAPTQMPTGFHTFSPPPQDDYEGDDILLLDVTPLSFGVAIDIEGESEAVMLKIIERNSVIPTKKQATVSLCDASQESIALRIYQGESVYANSNFQIGEFIIPNQKHEQFDITITMEIDVNGGLVVTANTPHGKYTLPFDSGDILRSEEEIINMLNDWDQEKSKEIEYKIGNYKSRLKGIVEYYRQFAEGFSDPEGFVADCDAVLSWIQNNKNAGQKEFHDKFQSFSWDWYDDFEDIDDGEIINLKCIAA